jgi:diguanylate cyclase (GGDEF)-like protein
MHWQKSIKNQLLMIILSICVVSLTAGVFIIGFNFYHNNRGALIADSTTQAKILAQNVKQSILTENNESALFALNTAVLDKLSSAAIFDSIGRKIAARDNDGSNYISEVEFKGYDDTYWGPDYLHVWKTVQDGDLLVGVVYLKISTSDFEQTISTYIITSIAILFILFGLTYLVANRLQKQISERLVELDELSREVSQSGNYSIRVPRYGDDEIGSLARSFNLMLETIEENQLERDKANEALHLNRRRLERAVKDLQYLANYDSLTQLPNRALCMDRIKYALKSAARAKHLVAVLFLDLDHFKDVNDSLGHAVGDQLLKATSQRLLDKIRSEDTLARLGGDEFVIILNNLNDTESVINIVEKIVSSFEEPFKLSSYEVNTTVSIGICMYPTDGHDVDSLMKAADAAMYKAKEVGRNTYEFYQADLNQLANRRHQLANELRNAVKNNELFLVFQPQLNLTENKIKSAEVLLRWSSPVLGVISPAEFIPIAESTGLIKDIGDWVLENACKTLFDCLNQDLNIRLAVNLSAMQFKQADLADQIANTLKRHRIPPQYLEVEITESMLMRDVHKAIEALERIKEMQIRIAIDDFGTGYSSLSYLRRFPLDALKIDQSFVDELVVDNDDTAITMAIISMAKSLRLEVIAEGVETQQQLDFLRENNCDDVQGYHLSKPLKENDFIAFLKAYSGENPPS